MNLLLFSLNFLLTFFSIGVNPELSYNTRKEILFKTTHDSSSLKESISDNASAYKFSIEVKNLDSAVLKVNRLLQRVNGKIIEISKSDSLFKKGLNYTIYLPMDQLDSFKSEILKHAIRINNSYTPENQLVEEISKIQSSLDTLNLKLKHQPILKRFAIVKLNIYKVLPKPDHFWRDFGTGLSGAGLALFKFAMILLKAWPIILLLIIIGYFGKFRYKPK